MKSISIKTFLILVSISLLAFKSEKDSLHERKFVISLDEVRNGVPSTKQIPDLMMFKEGRLWSEYANKKYGTEWVRYRITKDSVYIDSTETEVRLLMVEANETDETNQTVAFEFSVLEWTIEGTLKVSKNDKIKKYFDFIGSEKGRKPKKIRAPRQHIIEIQKEGAEAPNSQTITPPGNK
jgi:hypothetical protein